MIIACRGLKVKVIGQANVIGPTTIEGSLFSSCLNEWLLCVIMSKSAWTARSIPSNSVELMYEERTWYSEWVPDSHQATQIFFRSVTFLEDGQMRNTGSTRKWPLHRQVFVSKNGPLSNFKQWVIWEILFSEFSVLLLSVTDSAQSTILKTSKHVLVHS